MKLYKLTNCGKTQNETLWKAGKTVSIIKSKRHPKLCSDGVLHAYTNLNLGLLLNPCHANIPEMKLQCFEVEGKIEIEDYGKVGCYELNVVRQIKLPDWFVGEEKNDVRIAFAILCAESVLKYYEKYDSKDDRPRKAIEAAKKYLKKKTYAANAAADAADAADADEINFCEIADNAVRIIVERQS